MIREFKQFIAQGNVLDLAVAVVIAAAFSKITTSLVDDIIMPVVGILLGGINFSEWKLTLKDAVNGHPAVTMNVGSFLQNVVYFLIIAFVIFLVVKAANRAGLTATKPGEKAAA